MLSNSIPHLFELPTLYCTVHNCVPSPCLVLLYSALFSSALHFPLIPSLLLLSSSRLRFLPFFSFFFFFFLSSTLLFYPHTPHPYPALQSQAFLYFNRLIIFKARASMSTARNAVKGRARLRSSRTTTAPPLLSSTSLSFSSSFLAGGKEGRREGRSNE